MSQELAAQILTSDSDEIADLKANLPTLESFIDLAREINGMPNMRSRFFEESRSLYQVTASHDIDKLEELLSKFFGPPVKPSGKPLPRKLRKDSVVKYLGGIQKDQSLFIKSLKTGQFYGALWPWRRNKKKIEIHMGYCSDWMSDNDYEQLETLVQKEISHNTFEQIDTQIGGQIHGIGLPSFLQMAEMEKSSFTLRITSRNRVGKLHIDDGCLINADVADRMGAKAAFDIISWDDASIEIEPLDTTKTDEIKQPLMQVLMESLKIKDEAVVSIAEAAKAEQSQAPDEKDDSQPQKPRPRSQRPAPGRLVRLKRAPQPRIKRHKTSMLTLAAIALGTVGIITAVYVASVHLVNNHKGPGAYETVMSELKQTQSVEKKITLLQDYLDAYPKSPYALEVQNIMLELANKEEESDYEKIQLAISNMPMDEAYEKKAVGAYESFLEKYPNSRHKNNIDLAIVNIKELVDQHYYQELKNAARLNFNERLKIYSSYLEKFPDGSYHQDVKILIEKMGHRHLDYLSNQINNCEAKKNWEPCLKQFNEFINAYEGMPIGQAGEKLKNQMVDKRDFLDLRRQAMDAGTDYKKGYQLYSAYLADHPQTTQKKAIEKEMGELKVYLKGQDKWDSVKRYATNTKNPLINRIQKVGRYLKNNSSSDYAGDAQILLARLESERKASLQKQQILTQKRQEQERLRRERAERTQRQQRIQQQQKQLKSQLSGSSRFRPVGNDMVRDQSTGLTWALLDSQQETGGCLTYEAAEAYVKNLSLGGKKGWRLPLASELASIYKKPPYFPSSGDKWFWSSETYVKGYHSVSVVVTDKQETKFDRGHRKLGECGVVRAVR